MYLHSICGSWLDHPFWNVTRKIIDAKTSDEIKKSGIKEVLIDISKGSDISAENPPSSMSSKIVNSIQSYLPQKQQSITTVSQEITIASKICKESKLAVKSIFSDVRMGKTIDTVLAKQVVETITDSVTRNPNALVSLARLKVADDYTYMHSVAVCALMVALGNELGLSTQQKRSAGLAGLLHDIGKALVPSEIINKPDKLTDKEFEIVKQHPKLGYDLLDKADDADLAALDVCLHHHEKIDESGYPNGLKNDEIGIFSKMGAVCDVYDAITSNRPYKAGWDPALSLQMMAGWVGTHFEKRVFQAFIRSIGIYPIGSLVMMNNGRLGVVIEQNKTSLTTPKVKIFFSTKSNMHIPIEIIDTSKNSPSTKIFSREDPEKWKISNLPEMWGADMLLKH